MFFAMLAIIPWLHVCMQIFRMILLDFFQKVIIIIIFITESSNKKHSEALWQCVYRASNDCIKCFVFQLRTRKIRRCMPIFYINFPKNIFKTKEKNTKNRSTPCCLHTVFQTHWRKKIYSKLETAWVIIFHHHFVLFSLHN